MAAPHVLPGEGLRKAGSSSSSSSELCRPLIAADCKPSRGEEERGAKAAASTAAPAALASSLGVVAEAAAGAEEDRSGVLEEQLWVAAAAEGEKDDEQGEVRAVPSVDPHGTSIACPEETRPCPPSTVPSLSSPAPPHDPLYPSTPPPSLPRLLPPFPSALARLSSRLNVASWKNLLTPNEWATAGALLLAITALHAVGWGLLLLYVVPRHFHVGKTGIFGVGLGVTAYTLGMRHAFDADHIAAIDNTTRKFMAEGKRPLSVGFWFALGHSSVVFFAALLIAAGFKAFAGQVEDESSQLHILLGTLGAAVSGSFLILIGLFNLIVLLQIIKVLQEMRRGCYDEEQLEAMLQERGFMNRILNKIAAAVKQPWHMFPLGFLFGLGFDTATEVALLFMAASTASSGLPCAAILCLPLLFAAGMTLLDTIDGSFMNFAYGWAFSHPVRKIYFNIVMTGLSVAIALLIGGIEIVQIVIEKAKFNGEPWDFVAGLDLNIVGFVIVGLFVATWVVALLFWHVSSLKKLDQAIGQVSVV